MKIQSLAIIFVILILPISLVLTSYTQSRVETLNLQAEYDSKLNDATFDAVKAYQINSFDTVISADGLANTKIRNIEASVETFFNSISSNFSNLGYTKTTLQNFIPALVYTMYDGYYIYSPYTNTWGTDSDNDDIRREMEEQIPNQNGTYSNGQELFGLKPYVYYSARYKKGNADVVITYSLDNYIQIQGKIGDELVSKYGYLLNEDHINKYLYNIGTDIQRELIYISDIGKPKEYPCIKENGTKYYLDIDTNEVFTVINGQKNPQGNDTDIKRFSNGDQNAQKYYEEAEELRNFILSNDDLKDLTIKDIVNPDTGGYYSDDENPYTRFAGKIFDFDDNIESKESNFNTHRMDVIKYAIERNLAIVINNFNSFSNADTDFRMPKLKESDWDTIMENISVISFMQGVNIGGKVYSGYSIISNNKNEDIVMPDSIYIRTWNNTNGNYEIHRITEAGLADGTIDISGATGVFNVNLERRTSTSTSNTPNYYFPVEGIFSYESIVTQNGISEDYDGDLNEYIQNHVSPELQKIYYTALARERYRLYRPKL